MQNYTDDVNWDNFVYNFVERRVKLNNRASFHRKILIVFTDNIRLINY